MKTSKFPLVDKKQPYAKWFFNESSLTPGSLSGSLLVDGCCSFSNSFTLSRICRGISSGITKSSTEKKIVNFQGKSWANLTFFLRYIFQVAVFAVRVLSRLFLDFLLPLLFQFQLVRLLNLHIDLPLRLDQLLQKFVRLIAGTGRDFPNETASFKINFVKKIILHAKSEHFSKLF